GLLIPFGARVADPVPTQPAAGHLFSLADHLVRIGLRLRFGGSVVLVGGGAGGRGGGGRRSGGFGGRRGGKRDRGREGHSEHKFHMRDSKQRIWLHPRRCTRRWQVGGQTACSKTGPMRERLVVAPF